MFNWKNRSLGKRSTVCRACHKRYQDRHYEKNKLEIISRSRKNTIAKRKLFKEWKSTLSCCLCGESEEACIDFHHVDPTVKEHQIAELASSRQNHAKLKEELKKCVAVCRNCHTKIHKYKTPLPNIGVNFTGWD